MSGSSTHPIFGDVIYSYTRAQALEDGVLVDLTAAAPDVCAQHFKYPIACTAAVWAIIQSALRAVERRNDLSGLVHDILWMSRMSGRVVDATTRMFSVLVVDDEGEHEHQFRITCGPGDDAEPVLTVMLADVD